jgi:hypothetical protein
MIGTAIDTRMATVKLFEDESRFVAEVSGDEPSDIMSRLSRRIEEEIGRHRFCRFEFSQALDPLRNDSSSPVAIVWFDVDGDDNESREIGIMLASSILDESSKQVAHAIAYNHDNLKTDQAMHFVNEVKPRVRSFAADGAFAE